MTGELVKATPEPKIYTDLRRQALEVEQNENLESYRTSTLRADQRVATALTAIEEGRMLVSLRAVAAKMTNLLALAPAHRSGEDLSRRRDQRTGAVLFRSGRWSFGIPGVFDPASYGIGIGHRYRHSATPAFIPPIPPAHRVEPLKGKLILFEHLWSERAERPRMNLDPALLEHVVGDVWAVCSAWDLTPLEIAALGG